MPRKPINVVLALAGACLAITMGVGAVGWYLDVDVVRQIALWAFVVGAAISCIPMAVAMSFLVLVRIRNSIPKPRKPKGDDRT
jgi:predicted membrane metal-binding protein